MSGILAYLRRHAWLAAAGAGLVGFALVWLLAPHGREIRSGWEIVAKVLVFGCITLAVALLPNGGGRSHWPLYLAFLGFAGYVFPRVSYFYYGDAARAQADSFYTHLYLLMYPAVVLTAAAAYRLGGGSSGRCLKIAGTGALIVFSGFLDIMWHVVNPVAIPATIDAPHIVMLTGRPISFAATIVFALAHVPVIVALNLLPLDRWIGRVLGDAASADAAPGDAGGQARAPDRPVAGAGRAAP